MGAVVHVPVQGHEGSDFMTTNIPAELRQRRQWVVWKIVHGDGKSTKPPLWSSPSSLRKAQP